MRNPRGVRRLEQPFTAWEFLTLSINQMGTFGAVAYSQYGNLPLMQLLSATGLSGLTFLITWFGSTLNWIWERSFSWPAINGRQHSLLQASRLAI